MNTKEAVDLIEKTLRASLSVADQKGGRARFSVERLDGKPRRPAEPCVKLMARAADRQAYLLYIGSVDETKIERKTYDSRFLRGDEIAPNDISEAQVIADMVLFSAGVVAPLSR